MAVCALLLESLDLVDDMFCKLHRCFEEIFVLSLGEAGEWLFRHFKSLLYGWFEASFLAVQAYLMSAMITPEFSVPANDVLRVPFLVTFTMVKCALVLVFLVLVCKHHLFLGEMVNPVLGDASEWVSRVFKDQLHGAVKMFSLNWLSGSWTGYRVRDFEFLLQMFARCCPAPLRENAEFALEGIRQFFVAGEIEEVRLKAFCDMHETPWYGSSGFPVCLPRFGLRVHARCLGMVAQGTLESLSESNLAQKPGVCERMFRACVRHLLFWGQLVVRSQSLCGQCFASLSTFLSNWYSAAVSANPWNELHYVLRVTASQFLFVFF